ncbi:MAG TPA: hydrogenase formation protein HypD [Desulfobacterales bacterium]|nr:hydrogenase formation protein HypD [Desulfobacterales bacterium]HIP39918.1 hydrogenase formation protein HypD [Desulfocapsa sulfexigens]
MKYVDEYRNGKLVNVLRDELNRITTQPIRVMEVCGTHTMSIFRHGIRDMLPEQVQLISGPGCPVCVTPSGMIDRFVELAERSDIIITTFGDMIRVPGDNGSLAQARSRGAQVKIVYSPMDALAFAEKESDKLVVFLSVGFETTTPTIAATILEAKRRGIENFCVFPANKVMPPPLAVLMQDPELQLDGLLCPGHVSIITGSDMFNFLVVEYNLACVVAGFEPTDILQAIIRIVKQVKQGCPTVENCYGRVVTSKGNGRAKQLVEEVFKFVDTEWRGLGEIPKSGLGIRDDYKKFDVTKRLGISIPSSQEPKGCRCGEILKGICEPTDCPLFGKRCGPNYPVGPCMVSSEGTCAAWYRYGALEQ